MSKIIILEEILHSFPGLAIDTREVRGVRISEVNPLLEEYKETVYREVRQNYSLDTVKDVTAFRKYRDFFWKIGLDPTKVRPASEALIRRILNGRPLPRINTAVDAYNLSSVITRIPLAAFDADKITGDIKMRLALRGEKFQGIGMNNPMILSGGEVVMADDSHLSAVYPYRDADYSKVTVDSKNLLIISCGVPEISDSELKYSVENAVDMIKKFNC